MKRRDFVRSSVLTLSSALLAKSVPAVFAETPSNPDVKRVLAMFKCHFDAGFIDTQAAVVHLYFSYFFPQAITIAEQSRQTGNHRYVWTTGSWLLYEYLEQPVETSTGTAVSGPDPEAGVQFENVEFRYPGSNVAAVTGINLHIKRGESLALVGENGSGKTTLIKLLTRLYKPTFGRILLDGRDLQEWDEKVLRRRVGVIFQDFVRYQLLVGENIGAGDVREFENRERWAQAASEGKAAPFIEDMPRQYDSQLGKWFKDGRELSGGQWQKIALSRAFMRSDADILVLDEPTAAMDAAAEAEVFEHFRSLMGKRIAIVISHRFSTVRMADQIVVLDQGRIVERGNHESLMKEDRIYSKLFTLQARGYR